MTGETRDVVAPSAMSTVRVLSFGTAIAGNVTATTLAELGADVVKVESPNRPDPLRIRVHNDQPRYVEPGGAETNLMFAGYARSVRGIALDMRTEADRGHFTALLRVADVLIDNFAGGVMDRWGFGADVVADINPLLVRVSVSGYGRTGPKAHYMAYGTNVNAFTGLSRAWVAHGTQLDYGAVAHTVPAVLAGLAYRDRTGRGVSVDVAQTESGAALAAELYLDSLNAGPDVLPAPNAVAGSLLAGVFAARGEDRWVAVELEDAVDWDTACGLLESPRLRLEPGTTPPPGHVAALSGALTRWCAGRTPHQAMYALQRAGLAAGAVHDAEDLHRDPQHRARGFFVEIGHPDLGVVEYPAPFVRISGMDVEVRRPAPRVGQHTGEVLADWLEPSRSVH